MKKQASPITSGILNVLNGVSIGVIVTLMPAALLNELIGYLKPSFPQIAFIGTIVNFVMILLPVISGLCVAHYFKMKPLESATLALVASVGAGNWMVNPTGGFMVKGTGDVINIMVTIGFGVIVINLLGDRLGSYNVLLLPVLSLIIAGGLGMLTLTPVRMITKYIGDLALLATDLQPILMGIILGILFAVLILSPISSVGVATAISLTGIASGSANLGITAAAFALAIYGSKVNSLGTCIAHFLGTPKIQMANMLKKPKLFIPVAINAGIAGGIGAFLEIKGTPLSAGFGSAGLVGPINALKGGASIITIIIAFLVVPVLLGLISKYLFMQTNSYMESKDFYLDYQ
ncbi:PTS sugar transporter subunit IIC (plasmid) [Nicoliella spurrieriana]|uniref:PTS sugar transporter subunit IIC n=1 Tax=Nicoliella spurrieriana TaxID=2925830 RepID=A0A976RQJ5_9LACO|nr:PTS sugar transporter subunit IIC [Nicoliella spurrieriana]UQS85983.1 PTS sugar transporter subunit IIC [Nicoliella spurrieriana]